MAGKSNHPVVTQQTNVDNSAEIAEVLESLPKEKRELLEPMIFSYTSMISRVSPEIEIAKKITDQHITKILEARDKSLELEYTDNKNKRRYSFAASVLACVVVLIIILLLKDNPDVMEKVIIGLGGVITGALGGYGYKSSKDND